MPPETIDKAKALLKFGSQALHAMRLEEAEQALRQAAEIAAAAKHERVQARALARWFYAMAYQGRLDEVQPVIAKAGMEGVTHGSDEVAALVIQSCGLRFLAHDDPQTQTFLQTFLKGSEKHAQDPDVARATAQVAIVCNAMGNQKLAASLLERALPVMEASLGAAHPDVGLTLYNLADLRITLDGNQTFAKVEPMFRRAIAIQEAGLAPNHPERVMPIATLGIVLGRHARYGEARQLLERALAIAAQVEGPDGQTPQAVRRAIDELDSRLLEAPAEPYLLQAVAAAEQDPAAGAPGVALKLTALCRHYFARGKAKACEPHYRRLRALADGLGEMEQALLSAEMGIPGKIYVLLQQDRGGDAEKLLRGQLEVMERVLPAGHAEIHQHLYFTGNIYRMLGRHKDALKLFERYAAAERKNAEADPGRAEGLMRVLDAQLELGQKKDAARTAGEIARLTGRPPVMDPALNEFERQLRSVWHMLQLEEAPDLIGAALAGDTDAGLVVGLCYAAGQGVPPNPDKARPWFEAAAKAGHPAAIKILEALRQGKGVEIDLEVIAEAAKGWLTRPGGR